MENFDLIERYLLEKMTADERATFEVRMERDPDLRKEKDTMAELILGVESLGLKNELKGRKIGGEEVGRVVEMKSKSIFSIRKLAVAASFLLIGFCGWWMFQPSEDPTSTLFADAFFTDPGLPTPMSETKNYNFYDAMVDYKMEKYDVSLEKWKNVKEGIGADTLQFYQGMALLNLKKNEEAIFILTAVPQSSAFKDLADWYLISLYIKTGKFSEAKTLINKIPSNINSNYEAIKSFLETK
jgi:hypothetical protein